MPLVVVLIGQFCRDVIGCQNMKVAVIGRLLFAFFLFFFLLLSFLLFFVIFGKMNLKKSAVI